MKKSKILSLVLIVTILVSALTVGCSSSTPAPTAQPTATQAAATTTPAVKPIEIIWVSSFPIIHSTTVSMNKYFIDYVTQKSNGRIKFVYKGGAEVIPQPDTPKALQSGIIDMGGASVGYLETMAPGVGGAVLREISWDDWYNKGAFDYMAELCKVGGIQYMGNSTATRNMDFFQMFLIKKLEKPEDFKGYRMGGTPTLNIAMKAWGSVVTTVNVADYYTAVERGSVDGICSTTAEQAVASGMIEKIKFAPRPGIFESTGAFGMNLNKWKTIPVDLQKLLLDGLRNEADQFAIEHDDVIEASYKKLAAAGVQVYNFSPEMEKWIKDQAYEASWADQVAKFPNQAPKLKALIAPNRK